MATVKEVKLMKDGAMVTPVTLIGSVKNHDGTDYSGHNHDGRYYTESEIDSKISTLNTAINGKANSSHYHSEYATLTCKSYSSIDSAKDITLPSMNKGEWLYCRCATTDTGGSTGTGSSLVRKIIFPSGGTYLAFSTDGDIATGLYSGGHTVQNLMYEGTQNGGAVEFTGLVLRIT